MDIFTVCSAVILIPLRYEFSLIEEEENNQFVLEVACPKLVPPCTMHTHY